MRKLTTEQLEFIDTYLKNSGVKYIDVRLEMTDHVASAIEQMEGDFISCFKEYMLQHKKELMKSRNNFMRAAGRKAFKHLRKTMFSPLFLIVFFSLCVGLTAVVKYEGAKDAKDIFMVGYSFIIIAIFIHFVYNYAIVKIKYSVSDRLLSSTVTIFYWLVIIIHPERIIENEISLAVYYAFIYYIMLAIYYTFIKLVKKYKLQYG